MLWLAGSLIILLAVLTQSLIGFGSAMVVLVLLGPLLGLGVATPLVVLVKTRQAINLRAVWRLVAGPALIGVPLGVLALRRLPAEVMLPVTGVVWVVCVAGSQAAPT